MNLFDKKIFSIKKIKSVINIVFSCIGVIVAFSFWGIMSRDTLISIQMLCLISVIGGIGICIYYFLGDSFNFFTDFQMTALILFFSSLLSCLIFLSINFIFIPDQKIIETKYKIISVEKRRRRGKTSTYLKIKYRNNTMLITPPFQIKGNINDYKTLVLKTSKGIMGFEIIRDRKLIK